MTDQSPVAAAIAATRERTAGAGLAVVGTIDGHRQPAHPGSLEPLAAVLVGAASASGRLPVAVESAT